MAKMLTKQLIWQAKPNRPLLNLLLSLWLEQGGDPPEKEQQREHTANLDELERIKRLNESIGETQRGWAHDLAIGCSGDYQRCCEIEQRLEIESLVEPEDRDVNNYDYKEEK